MSEEPVKPFQLTQEVVQKCRIIQFDGKIKIIDRAEQVGPAVRRLQKEKLLGFDTETRPNFTKGKANPIALLQLATDTEAFLFRLIHTGMPLSLAQLLENPAIIKVGQEPEDEMIKLFETYQTHCHGMINLGVVASHLDCKPRSLKGLSAIFLGHRISKASQTSNWENEVLTPKQITYAATDAWVCRRIYQKLQQEKLLEDVDALMPDNFMERKAMKKKRSRRGPRRGRNSSKS